MLHCILGRKKSLIVALLVAISFAGAVRQAPAQAQSEGNHREIRSYSVQPDRLQNLLEVFRQLYAQEKGATFTADAKGGELVVAAPDQVQKQVEAFLKRSGYLREGKSNVAPVKAATPDENSRHQQTRSLGNGLVEIEVKLRQADWRQVESRTAQLLGERPPVALTAEGAIATLTLPTKTDKKVAMQIYRNDNVVRLRGVEDAAKAWSQVVRAIDSPRRSDAYRTDLVSLRNAKRADVEEALAPIADTGNGVAKREIFEALKEVAGKKELRWSGDMAAMIFQPDGDQQPEPAAGEQPPAEAPAPELEPADAEEVTIGPEDDAGLIGPVQIEFLEGLDVIVVRGHRRDVERITRIINDIERLSAETQPVIEVRELLHANSEAVAATIQQLYEDLLQTRYGQVSITPLGRPNAILLIGRQQSVDGILDLIDKLDQPTGPERQLRVFQLKYISSADAQTRVTEFYADPVNLNPRVRSTADYRSNALIVQASPRDMAEVEYLIRQIDVPAAESTMELRVFELKNSLAEDLATVLQSAISGTPQATTGGQQQGGGATAAQVRAAMLSFMTLDSRDGQLLKSGILTDAQITADTRSNALVVRAPKESMELISALIQRLDAQPSAESQIKVFTIVNGDATQLATMLETLFGLDEGQTQGQLPFQVGAGGESSLVPIRFSVDSRTNSIIASGSASDLAVVEAILLRLDQDDVQQRQMLVVRLKNSNADLVAASLTDLLQNESQLQSIDPNLTSSFQQIAREVIVVPETFSNSLIITATPRYFKEIVKIVEELDARPPMVAIQVLIADVQLGKIEELGFEFGLQDSLLFDRSTVSSGQLDPGFDFNNNPLGNSASAASLATASAVGSQGLSDLGLGRTNPGLGYGGFVFSAASESVNVLIRALQQDNRMEVLARPHVMTMDNQPAFIQVGQRVPYITDTQVTNQGTVNSIT
ncbi:MAG: secretin N-terminal domain-containing protein, partial [Blastopirellula sp. JB062]